MWDGCKVKLWLMSFIRSLAKRLYNTHLILSIYLNKQRTKLIVSMLTQLILNKKTCKQKWLKIDLACFRMLLCLSLVAVIHQLNRQVSAFVGSIVDKPVLV